MRRMNVFMGALAMSSFVFAASAQAAASGSAQSGGGLAGDSGQVCRVKVSRSAASGAFNVSRQVLDNGSCVCRVTTGPRSQGGSAESALAGMLQRRSCADAPLASAATTGTSGIGQTTLIVGGLLIAGGVGAIIATTGGSSSP